MINHSLRLKNQQQFEGGSSMMDASFDMLFLDVKLVDDPLTSFNLFAYISSMTNYSNIERNYY